MLHALKEYAIREKLTAEPGLKPKMVRWLLLFSPQGQFLGVQNLAGDDRKSKGRVFPNCPDLSQPEMIAIGAGCRHFLVDSMDVVTFLTKDGQIDDKLTAKHDFFVGLLEQASSDVPSLAPIAAALRDDATLEAIRAGLTERKAKPMDLGTFVVEDSAGPLILVESDDWHSWWQTFRSRMADERKAKSAPKGRRQKAEAESNGPSLMRCLLSGELVEPLPTHNKIEGLSDVGGLSMGDALTSFDKDAFGSYGLEQGANAAMSETMVKTYVTALNDLIRHHSHRMAGVKIVYWYSGKVDPADDPLPQLFGDWGVPDDEKDESFDAGQQERQQKVERLQAESCARRLLEAIEKGDHSDLKDVRYYALSVSANSGRVVVRDWMEGTFPDLVEAVDAWFTHLEITARDGRSTIRYHKFPAVLAAPLRDLKDATASTTATLWHCALKRLSIPHSLMAQTLMRVRNGLLQGETPLHARFGLLKAFCNRNERLPHMNSDLNELENDPAYLCGRIMALLANIQQAALGDVGAGIVQRYYAAASATPALVLGRLVRTAQIGHLPKLEGGLQRWFGNQLAEVWSKFSQNQKPPAVLSLEGQTLFAMGYYQQMAKRFSKSSEATEQQATSK
jgi:CRISPR-associated protein Csd1